MNFNISNISAPAPVTPPSAPDSAAPATSAGGVQEPVIVDTIPPTPPDEVLEQIALAGQMYDKLRASGVQLHFATNPMTGKVAVTVLDSSGTPIGTVPASKVLQAAATGTLS